MKTQKFRRDTRTKAVDPEDPSKRCGIHTDYFWFNPRSRIPANQKCQPQQFISWALHTAPLVKGEAACSRSKNKWSDVGFLNFANVLIRGVKDEGYIVFVCLGKDFS
jgi:hypothetical protein